MLAKDGIVLAADSLETVDEYLKVFKPKLVELPLISSDLKCVVVGAGDGPFVDEIMEEISEALDLIEPSTSAAKQAIQRVVTKTCNRVWPLYTRQVDKPQATLLIGLRGNDGLCLLEAPVPMIKAVDRYTFIGAGRVLAIYKAKQLMPDGVPLHVGIPLLTHILDTVSKNADGCGGDTHLAVIHPDGTVEHKSQDYLKEATQGYRLVSWALDTFIYPFLPLVVSDDGKDYLGRIAGLGEPTPELKKKISHALSFLAERKKGILAGNPLPAQETTEKQRLTTQLLVVSVAIKMILNTLPILHRDGALSDELLKETDSRYEEAWGLAQPINTTLSSDRIDDAKREIARVFSVLMRLPPPPQTLTAQTPENQP